MPIRIDASPARPRPTLPPTHRIPLLAFAAPLLAGAALAAAVLPAPAAAQDDRGNPEARRLASLVPESVGSLERTTLRTGMQGHGYPALEAEFEGPSGTLLLFVLYEGPEGGQLTGMLSAATGQDRAEPWELRDLEAWKIVEPNASGPEAGPEQRMVRVRAEVEDVRDAWVLAVGPEGSGDALDELMEGLELERLGAWAAGFAEEGR